MSSHSIAPEDHTRWYREYWLKVAAACLCGLSVLGSLCLVALLDEHVQRMTEGLVR